MNPAHPANSSDRYVNTLNRLIDGQDWPRTLETARTWLAEDPENTVAHRVAGQALINLERYPEAQRHLVKTLAANPNHAFAHRLVSIAYFRQGNFAKADEHVQRALELMPEDAQNWHHLASMRYQHGALELAAKHARRALELQPNNPHVINLLALCNQRDGLSQYTYYLRALELDPENGVVHNNLGVHHLNVDRDYAAAEASFRQALRLDPTDKTAQQNLLLVLRHRDRFYQALRAPLTLVEKVSWGKQGRGMLARVGLVGLWLALGKIFWGILILWFALIFPLQKAYEYLTIGDIRAEAGILGARRGGPWGYRRWPFAVRFGILAVLTLAFWGGVYLAFRHSELVNPALLAGLISLTALFFLGLYAVRRGKKSRLRWLAKRSEKRLARRLAAAGR